MTRTSVLTSLAAFVIAQASWVSGQGAKTPMTPWGEPDLQGTWTAEAELSVPFERPREYGTRQVLTDAEFKQRQSQSEQQLQSDNSDFDLETADRSTAGQVGSATSPPPHWLERRKVSRRTSLVIDPPDGRVPPLTREAQARAQARGPVSGDTGADRPQDLSLWVRCIGRGMPSAIFPTVYNANVQIVQAPGVVALTYEMIHDTRIIYTDGKAARRLGRPRILRRFEGTLGGRYARRRRHELQRQEQLPRIARHAAPGGALQASR